MLYVDLRRKSLLGRWTASVTFEVILETMGKTHHNLLHKGTSMVDIGIQERFLSCDTPILERKTVLYFGCGLR